MPKSRLLVACLILGGCGGSADVPNSDDSAPAQVDVYVPQGGLPDVPMCGDMLITPHGTNPNLLLAVDHSGSMNEPISSSRSQPKLDDTKTALTQLLDQGRGTINFGLLTYPEGSQCGVGSVSVDCSDSSVPTIQDRVNSLRPNGGTPTGPALTAALGYSGLHDASRTNFVVLLTDGKPTCPSGNGREESPADQQAAIDAAAALHAQAIDTFVIGIGEDLNASNPDVLNQMAEAGGRPRSGAVKYYQANSLDDLNAAFGAIGDAVFGCTFTLSPQPPDPSQLWVTFDDQLVARDASHLNGWDYDSQSNQLTAYGAACSLLQGGGLGSVEIWMGCAAPTVPEY